MSKYAEISVVNVGHNPKSEKVIKIYIPEIHYTFTLYNNALPPYGFASEYRGDVEIYDTTYDVIKDFYHNKFKNMNPSDYDRNDRLSDAVDELQERLDAALEDLIECNDDED
jgi:hypothetical protein